MSVFRKITSAISFLLPLCIMIFFLTAPARYAESVLNGFALWVTAVLPTTFPFLFLTGLLTHSPVYPKLSNKLARPMGKLFNVSGAGGGAMLLSALSGYPVGARTVGELVRTGTVPSKEALRLSCLCSTSGPMFLIGTVGCMLYRNVQAGVVLLLSHLFAVWLSGILTRPFFRAEPSARPVSFVRINLADEMYAAVTSVLSVGGFIALFSCFSRMLCDLGLFRLTPFGQYSEGIFTGLLEMTAGCNALSAIQTPLSLAFSCFLVTWGGVCVIAQQWAFLSRTGIKPLPFLLTKGVQATLAFALCFALAQLLPIF